MPHDVQPNPAIKNAAVAMVLRPTPGGSLDDTDVLFIRRARSDRDHWSGHMALPGGRLDPSDPTLIHTAIRETQEETGLNLVARGSLLGRIAEVHPVGGGVPSVTIWPFVFSVEPGADAWVNSPEVGEVHWYSLGHLSRPEHRDLYRFDWRGEERRYPCIRIENRVIWGLTYRILESFLAV